MHDDLYWYQEFGRAKDLERIEQSRYDRLDSPKRTGRDREEHEKDLKDTADFISENDQLEKLAEFGPLPRGVQEIAHIELVEASNEILDVIKNNPRMIENLNPQEFEDFIEAIYRNQGFDIERLGSVYTRDGGVDLIAITKSVGIGEIRLAIQCKTVQASLKKQRGISAKPIRELAGVLDKFRAHKGILTTTGRFTKNAWLECEKDFYRIALEDKKALIAKIDALFPEARMIVAKD